MNGPGWGWAKIGVGSMVIKDVPPIAINFVYCIAS